MKSTLFLSFLLLVITGYSQVMTITLRFNQVIELHRKAIFLSTNSAKENNFTKEITEKVNSLKKE